MSEIKQSDSLTPKGYFNSDITPALIKHFAEADVIKVCSAWFTCPLLLKEIGKKESELIIGCPHRLDPSSPDFRKNWVKDIHDLLEENAYVYYGGKDGQCHHKFAILCNYDKDSQLQPYAVITGSYNYTIAAKTNQENVVYVPNIDIAKQYLVEFGRLKAKCHRLTL
jgi:phosphatidylserine/phosphatidylglycerophosphate/cardiolipin synthase-like enzyme